MKLSKTTALILALATGCTAAANTVVEWSTLGNVTDSAGNNSYTQRFVVKGDTDFARLAFNQFARKMQPVNPADTLVEIVPGYYAVASPRFASAAGQPVTVDITTRGALQNICYGPDGVHVVKADGTTAPVELVKADITASPSLYSTAKSDRMPYGDIIFDKNASRGAVALDHYDIVPSLKKVEKLGFDIPPTSYELEFVKTDNPTPDWFRATVRSSKVTVETNNPDLAAERLSRVLLSAKPVPAAVIEDWPDFPYRGLMIDIARNYQTPDEMRRVIDLMDRYGLNHLHFHITDDEAWRLEIPGLPELTKLGGHRGYTLDSSEFLPQIFTGNGDPAALGGTANGYLTREDFIDLLRYAEARGVKVIPEIESPGHARAAIYAMEKRWRDTGDDTYRLADSDDKSEYTSAQAFHDNVMNLAMPGPLNFMEKVGAEIKAMYDEAGVQLPAIDIGGDEVAQGAWKESPIARKYMKKHGIKNERDLHLIYIKELVERYAKLGIPVSGWQEIAVGHSDEFNASVRPHVYSVNCWSTLGPQSSITRQSAEGGYPTVLSNVDHFYLDMCYNYHPYERGLTWGGTVDEFDALHGYPRRLCDVDSAAFRNIKGISGQVFAETMRSGEMLESFLLPKMLGLAERAWNADSTYTDAKFNTVIAVKEVPAWLLRGYNFHLSQPGIRIADGMVEMNTPYDSRLLPVIVRYTLDGSEPTADSPLYREPFAAPAAGQIRAKAFLNLARNPKESLTSILIVK